ncbi:MAG: hypothetical protein Q9202_003878 [Teloschistes flavicans]
MCIHHLQYHAPCGHTTQSSSQIVHCYPVTKALEYYHNQPNDFKRGRPGRAITLDPMKNPRICGASSVRALRNIIRVGSGRDITPEGWQPWMTKRVRKHLENGEDVRGAIILLEAEIPALTNRILEDWIQHLRRCFHNRNITWRSPEDLQNDHVGGDIVTGTNPVGCGHFVSGDPRCFTNWNNPYGGGPVFCPFKWSHDTGLPIPPRPDHIPAEQLPNAQTEKEHHDANPETFEERFRKELWHQAEDYGQVVLECRESHPSLALGPGEEQVQALVHQHQSFHAILQGGSHRIRNNPQEHSSPSVRPGGNPAGVPEQNHQPSLLLLDSQTMDDDDASAEASPPDNDNAGMYSSSTPDLRNRIILDAEPGEDEAEPSWMTGVDGRIPVRGKGKARSV